MAKLFQHKFIIRIIAFTVLTVATINISLPKIEEYNSAVYEEQNRLKIEASGIDNRTISFEVYSFYKGVNFNSVFTVILLSLFLSLLLTKRIVLSLFFAFQLLLQLIILKFLKIDSFGNSDLFEFLFMVCWFSLSFGLSLAICRLIYSKFQVAIFLK